MSVIVLTLATTQSTRPIFIFEVETGQLNEVV